MQRFNHNKPERIALILIAVLCIAMATTVLISLRVGFLVLQSSRTIQETEQLISKIDNLGAIVNRFSTDCSSETSFGKADLPKGNTAVSSLSQALSDLRIAAEACGVASQRLQELEKQSNEVMQFGSIANQGIKSPSEEKALLTKVQELGVNLQSLRSEESKALREAQDEWNREAMLLSANVIGLQVLAMVILVVSIVLFRRFEAQRRKAQMVLKDLATLVEFSQESIFGVDEKGLINRWNPGSEKMFRSTRETVLGQQFQKMILKQSDGKRYTEALRSGEIVSPLEMEFCRSDGTVFWGAMSISPISLTRDKSSHFTVVIRDVTEQVNIRFQQADFIASLTHDLKNPIIANNHALLQLMRSQSDQSEVYLLLNKVTDSNRQMILMLTDMLDVYKMHAGIFKANKMPVLIRALVSGCLESFSHQAESKRVTLESSLNCTSKKYFTDPLILSKILKNLLDNAVRYSPNDSTVKLDVRENKEQLFFSVEDCGVGVDEDKVPTLFQRSADGYSQNGSTGVGLYLSRQLALLIGGQISYQAVSGGGSRFELHINREPCEEEKTTADVKLGNDSAVAKPEAATPQSK
ncbi:MAG: PAS domain-containing sensor histidine kinase [Candidatus Obscuribacterales bacterium]|nr:PAS domain-containing sensor histidine kinase [Candidatus Obscuribacterales bacterium]